MGLKDSTRRAMGLTMSHLPESVHRMVPASVRDDLRYRTGWTRPGDLGHKFMAPGARPGETLGPPDFVVAGPLVNGTRHWFNLIADHPRVAPPREINEAAHLFSDFATEEFSASDATAFQRWFPRITGQQAGYWSPTGLVYPWIAPLIVRCAPEARWLVMMRDPVERLVAVINTERMDWQAHPGGGLAEAVDGGFYARQLTALFELVPPESVLAVPFEQWASDPDQVLARADGFLGLPPSLRPPQGPTRKLPGRHVLEESVSQRLRDLYREDVEALVRLVPDFDLGRWPNFADLD